MLIPRLKVFERFLIQNKDTRKIKLSFKAYFIAPQSYPLEDFPFIFRLKEFEE